MVDDRWSRGTPKDNNLRPVSIISVNLATRKAEGMTRERSTLVIDISYPVGGMLVTPATGEYWFVQRSAMMNWTLVSRIPQYHPEQLTEAVEGQVHVGSSGPLELNGDRVNINAPVFSIGGTMYRDDQGTLQVNIGTSEAPIWSPIASTLVSLKVPYDLSYIHTYGTNTRTEGYGDNPAGVLVQRSVLFKSVTLRGVTADASGDTTVELRLNGGALVDSVTVIPYDQLTGGVTTTGSWLFAPGDVLTVYVSGVGSSPGNGLSADLVGELTSPGAESGLAITATMAAVASKLLFIQGMMAVTDDVTAAVVFDATGNTVLPVTASSSSAVSWDALANSGLSLTVSPSSRVIWSAHADSFLTLTASFLSAVVWNQKLSASTPVTVSPTSVASYGARVGTGAPTVTATASAVVTWKIKQVPISFGGGGTLDVMAFNPIDEFGFFNLTGISIDSDGMYDPNQLPNLSFMEE